MTVVAVVGGAVLAGIGFTGSYSALVHLGFAHGFGWFSRVFPIGIDAGIVVLLALDLHLIRRQTPWPMLRLLAHLLTGCTVYFNASAAGRNDTVGAAMHAVLPLLFVASVEAGRRLVVKAADLEAGRESAGVPLHRWLLAPVPSWRMYRRMKLWDIGSYAQAVGLERERIVYRALLDRRYGDWRKAPSDARLPFTMARFGLSVDEALALPQKAEEAERLRAEAEQARQVEAETRSAERAAEAEVARLRARGTVEAARHQIDAETGVAAVEARAAKETAEASAQARARAAAEEAQAFESLDAAEANKRAAETEEAAAETRRRAAETDRAAAGMEREAAETRRRSADAERAAAVAEREAEAAKEAAEAARLRAAETRARVAGMELRAVEAEDAARLTPRERAARKVARMILATGSSDPEAVELQTIADALGVSTTTASERRREAAELLADGYRPTAANPTTTTLKEVAA
ncbi:DUF2637 domain-containing protein [Streptantibioticus rubrisoli]|uniref:DUF2637 domain-containing protein n=1 Tax=Streptantibioticus rubrisoli TaxID=1387313 RepID=A0ABT1PET7_9ACTN|nr:DUF2637 domain-containing protein [Streptantibioticus rubrisoli]MCQ4043877.1 DUF2637 domain-containing protein [Streptantibioticus rubrisoli]